MSGGLSDQEIYEQQQLGKTSSMPQPDGDWSALLVLGLIILVAITFAVGSGTNETAKIAAVIFFPAAIALYFAPSIAAGMRKRSNAGAIFLLNLFLGWTLLGWVGALVWAYSSPGVKPTPAPNPVPAPEAATRPCPYCAEDIRPNAIVCRFCGRDVQPA